MRKIATCFLMVVLVSCGKNGDDTTPVQEDLVVKAMTDGQWAITIFTLNGNNITPDFYGYRFKYYSNKTVDAKFNGNVVNTGTWDGSASTMTTSANFPGAVYPLTLINGSWRIDRSSWTYVEASQTIGSDTKTMKLVKE
ncbi:MAG: hypothetical protein V9F01_14075 [Chitinophagaceae bacterium]